MMKTHFIFTAFVSSLLLFTGVVVRAQSNTPDPVPSPGLAVIVVETVERPSNNFDEFNRIARVFSDVFASRKWPTKVSFERFAANNEKHAIEMQVVFKGIRQETINDLTFRAWVTLHDNGQTTDFGIVRFSYFPRPGMDTDDALDESVRGAAEIIADKAGAILFPKKITPKP